MKIAIVKLSALGDIIHAMVALQFIKQEYPENSQRLVILFTPWLRCNLLSKNIQIARLIGL